MKVENDIWKDVLDVIKERVSRPTFDTWFKGSKAKKEGKSWFIIAENEFARDWIEMRYMSLVQDSIYAIANELPELVFTIDEKRVDFPDSDSKVENILSQISRLNAKEKQKLFDFLKKDFFLGLNAEFLPSEADKSNKVDDLNRVNRLEKDVTRINHQLNELRMQVESKELK